MSGRRMGNHGEIWPDDKTKVCATCGKPRMRHSFGLYHGYCPDEMQRDMLPDGRWKPNAKVMNYVPQEPSA